MNRAGKRIIKRFPEHSPIHNSDNHMHGLINHGIGKWWDLTEDLVFSVVMKRKLGTNVSDEDNPDTDEYRLAGELLDRIGDEYGLKRFPKESNTDFKLRILAYKGKDISVASIKQLVSSLLSINHDRIEVFQPRGFCVGDDVGSEHVIGMQYVRGYFVLKIDLDYFDMKLIKDSVMNTVLAGVQFNIENKDGMRVA